MSNEVFANGLEVACKAADGKSIACFPDVCFTPPSPPAGWIPVPYANTAYAKDTANASKTVMISGKPIMKKDVSYFKTSTGNEPAAGPKGIITGQKKGKAYFTSWSMNVKIEGQNVDRHSDLTTHNHGSKPGNTGPWAYVDTSATNNPCAKEIKKMDKECKDNAKDKNQADAKKGKKKGSGKAQQKQADNKSDSPGNNAAWKEQHCRGLENKPYEVKKEDLAEFKQKLEAKIKESDVVNKVIDETMKEIEEKMIQQIEYKVAKAALKKPVQAVLGPLGWIWAAYDVYDGVKSYTEMKEKLNQLKKAADEVKNLDKQLKDIEKLQKNFNKDEATKMMADAQQKIAVLDGCMRARKCQLVSYKDSNSKSKTNNKGCCPGQTGHHLIPKSYIKDSGNCKSYDENEAATVCAEGTSHAKGGSHEALHTKMNKTAGDRADSSSKIKYDDAIDAAVESHRQTFPFSNCSEKCLKAQLMNDKKKTCAGEKNPDLKFKKIGREEAGDDR